jgi:hypothetical protein
MAKIKFNEDNLNQEQTNEEGNLSPVDEKVSPFHENTLRPEQIGVDDLLINQYMPVLYQAIVNNNVAAIHACLQAYDKQMEDTYTADQCTLYDIHSIYNATVENTLNNAALGAHQGLTPIKVAHQLGHHHICKILINTYADDPHCYSETIPPVELIGE